MSHINKNNNLWCLASTNHMDDPFNMNFYTSLGKQKPSITTTESEQQKIAKDNITKALKQCSDEKKTLVLEKTNLAKQLTEANLLTKAYDTKLKQSNKNLVECKHILDTPLPPPPPSSFQKKYPPPPPKPSPKSSPLQYNKSSSIMNSDFDTSHDKNGDNTPYKPIPSKNEKKKQQPKEKTVYEKIAIADIKKPPQTKTQKIDTCDDAIEPYKKKIIQLGKDHEVELGRMRLRINDLVLKDSGIKKKTEPGLTDYHDLTNYTELPFKKSSCINKNINHIVEDDSDSDNEYYHSDLDSDTSSSSSSSSEYELESDSDDDDEEDDMILYVDNKLDKVTIAINNWYENEKLKKLQQQQQQQQKSSLFQVQPPTSQTNLNMLSNAINGWYNNEKQNILLLYQ